MGTVDKLAELQYRRSVIENGGGEACKGGNGYLMFGSEPLFLFGVCFFFRSAAVLRLRHAQP